MSQITDITLAKVTGNTVFAVVGTQAGDNIPARLRGPGSALAAPRLRALTRRVKGSNKSKVQISLDYPQTSQIAGAETLVSTAFVNITIDLPDNTTEAQRLDMCKNVESLFAQVLIKDLIAKDSPMY